MVENQEKAESLSLGFFSQLAQKRMFALQIAELAVSMANALGEPVVRPLTLAQLQRAIDANLAETGMVMDLILEWADQQHRDGRMSSDDIFYRR